MRGPMAKPSGEIIGNADHREDFREALNVLQCVTIISTHGAR